MAVRLHEWQHPFGVVRTNGVDIVGFDEKPVARTHINAGVYVLEPSAIDSLKLGEPCDMPTLFSRLRAENARTIVYPMHEPWLDVGREADLAQRGFSAAPRPPARWQIVVSMIWEFADNDFTEVREALRIFGFAVIRNVLDRDEVQLVRSELDRAFGDGHLKEMPTLYSSEILKHERVWGALFKDRVVNSLRAALGPELYYQHDLDVQRNSYGLTGWKLYSGWHMDAGSETGNEYLRSADYRFVKCGIYLQDFDNGWGGGIRIKPKSHRGLFESNGLKRRIFFCRRALNRIALMLHMDARHVRSAHQSRRFVLLRLAAAALLGRTPLGEYQENWL